MTKRYKFSEDSYLYYWEAIVAASLIIIFLVVVILLLGTFKINYEAPPEAKPKLELIGTFIKAVAEKCFAARFL